MLKILCRLTLLYIFVLVCYAAIDQATSNEKENTDDSNQDE